MPGPMANNYPYSRAEECSWQPEEAARKLFSLLSENHADNGTNADGSGISSSTTSTVTSSVISPSGTSTKTTYTTTKTTNTNNGDLSNNTNDANSLLSRGWNASQIPTLRSLYGRNSLKDDDSDSNTPPTIFQRILSKPPFNSLRPICSSFLDQLKEPLILMLLASAGLSILLGNAADAISISIALTIVSLVAAIQEYRSERALEKLHDLVADTCTVIRDGKILDHCLTPDLVVGDLIVLSTGDRIPADCRLVDTIELNVDESSLTGENHPVKKTSQAITRNLYTSNSNSMALTDQTNVAFMGTLVVNGRGRALVIAVGECTEFGKVHRELSQVEERKSPLQIKIDELGKVLAMASSAVIAVIALVGWILGRPFLETVTVAVSLAVAAIPEGLPICVAVTLALGVLRMAKRNAIVKKLTAVEALGCTTVVASDKTGTLTQNEMTAKCLYTLAFPHSIFHLSGVGYDFTNKKGNITRKDISDSRAFSGSMKNQKISKKQDQIISKTSPEYGSLSALFNVASICNNATLAYNNENTSDSNTYHHHTNNIDRRAGITLSGQPTELALLVGAAKAGIPDPRPLYHRLQEIPFTSERKRMEVKARPVSGTHACDAFALANHASDNSGNRSSITSADESLYFVKGMPETIIGECQTHTGPNGSKSLLSDHGKTRLLAQYRKMAAGGLRVLAMAYGPNLEDLTFAGIIGMEDPPREGVAESVRKLRKGGVKVIMVTGDSKETALAIANRCGIFGAEGNGYSIDREEDGDLGKGMNKKIKEWNDVNDLFVDNVSDSSSDGLEDMDLESGAGFAMSGEDLDSIPARNLSDSILGVRVFYRVAPRHKLTLVRALQSHGEIVSMTGDGVNDATALKVS